MHGLENPALTVALAMLLGVLAKGVARHARVPGIVALLIAGVALGPDGAGIILPETMGEGLPALVGFAVAVILFEGGLQLNLRRLRRQAKPIRRLVTLGALVTAVGGALAARWLMDWPWHLSALFGTLVIVTGPTVVNPLLHRIRLLQRPATILEAEGIFIDAVGATIAAVALEVVLAPASDSVGLALWGTASRVGIGALVGAVGGALLALLIRWPKVVPAGLQNVLGLAFAMGIFQVSQSLAHESGITAAIVAGLVVGNSRGYALEQLVEFKEQLTTLFIATLFVLLSADVRIADVVALGPAGLATVAALMFLVRPASVFLCGIGTDLRTQEKLFLSWLAPRGIVAAAVASLFAVRLAEAGIEGGIEMRALVFLVIAVTVTVQGLSGGPIASLLRVRRPPRTGYLILGANAVGLHLAGRLRDAGEEVTLVDANPDACSAAEEAGFKVVYGNALEARTLKRARADGRAAALALTENEKANFLIARKIQDTAHETPVFVALETGRSGVTAQMVEDAGAEVLFARARSLRRIARHLLGGTVVLQRWRLLQPTSDADSLAAAPDSVLPLIGSRDGKPLLIARGLKFRQDDELEIACAPEHDQPARTFFAGAGWAAVEPPAGQESATDELSQ